MALNLLFEVLRWVAVSFLFVHLSPIHLFSFPPLFSIQIAQGPHWLDRLMLDLIFVAQSRVGV